MKNTDRVNVPSYKVPLLWFQQKIVATERYYFRHRITSRLDGNAVRLEASTCDDVLGTYALFMHN